MFSYFTLLPSKSLIFFSIYQPFLFVSFFCQSRSHNPPLGILAILSDSLLFKINHPVKFQASIHLSINHIYYILIADVTSTLAPQSPVIITCWYLFIWPHSTTVSILYYISKIFPLFFSHPLHQYPFHSQQICLLIHRENKGYSASSSKHHASLLQQIH